MKVTVLVLMSLLSLLTYSNEIEWDSDIAFQMDIDCDGKVDDFYLGYVNNDFIVKAVVSSQEKPDQLQFGLSQPSRQDAICGDKPKLSIYESSPEMMKEMFGGLPEGYKSGPQCFELNISGGDCDSIHVFWNHKANRVNWWRL